MTSVRVQDSGILWRSRSILFKQDRSRYPSRLWLGIWTAGIGVCVSKKKDWLNRRGV